MPVKTLIQRIPHWGEFLVVCGLCWGWFGVRSTMSTFGKPALPTFDNEHFIYLACLELAFAFVAYSFLRFRGWSIKDFPIRITWTTTGAGVLLLLIDFLLNWLAYDIGRIFGSNAESLKEIIRSISVTLPVAIVVSLVNGAFEELFFAGYVFKALQRHGLAFTLGVSALLRMVAHLYQGPVGALSILCMGIFYGLVYWRYRQLWPLMIAHIAVDFFALTQ